MNRYCVLEPVGKVDLGDFYEYRVRTVANEPFHAIDAFVEALANRIMQWYESQPLDDLLELETVLDTPERTKYFYRRLFDEDQNGQYTQEFVTAASETMGHWVEEGLDQVLCAYRGGPHNNYPAFDTLSVYLEDKTPCLRVVQTKATDSSLQSNCALAIAKFEKLERGDYDAELSNQVNSMLEKRKLPGVLARELKLNRRYRVTVIHNQEREGIRLMTTYHEKIRGDTIRRSSVLMKIDWANLWEQVARRIYAQLT